MTSLEVRQGDALSRLREMPDGSVQTCVTSPPYWGLRDYRIDGQLGLEATPEEYVANMVEVFREVKRVLRDDGTLWLNLGDSYTATSRGGDSSTYKTADENRKDKSNEIFGHDVRRMVMPTGLKPKDLVGIPWRVAFALQKDGWYLRSDIIWHKPNPMPESMTDRPTKSHEYIFLLTKSARYFYDADAIAEPTLEDTLARCEAGFVTSARDDAVEAVSIGANKRTRYGLREQFVAKTTRNRRTVWTITTKPYAEAHFATFPPELPQTCIEAGTSERGCCSGCGAPWERVVERGDSTGTDGVSDHSGVTLRNDALRHSGRIGETVVTTTGWRPTCDHDGDPVPCVVLDPFSGAGTTGMVAARLGRSYIGIELNPDYAKMSNYRIVDDCPLFNTVEGGT